MNAGLLFIPSLAAAVACSSALAGHPKPRPTQEFETCQINVEQNATDGDTEVVILAIGGDEGFRSFGVRSPEGRYVVQAFSLDRSVMGQRELLFESPEPPGDAILAGYPEGTYRCKGQTFANERFLSEATLSHQMPSAATILSPEHESLVPIQPLLIQWSAVPDTTQILLEIENESVDPEQVFSFALPPDATSFELPASVLVSGSSYQVSVGTVGPNGNKVFVEVEFETQ